MLFERFISKERGEPPDIDVDFEHQRREEVIQYIYGKYGRDRAAIAAAVSTYRPRGALRETGKALGVDPQIVDAVAKSHQWFDGKEDLLNRFFESGLNPETPLIQLWASLASQLLGFPRHLSQHSGGFVISRGKLTRLVPVENAAMVSFALLVYASSWLKRHEPGAFLAAMLNSQPMGFYSPSQLVQDATRHGGCPREHRSDSLSAAFKNLTEQEDFTTRYAALLDHYGMEGTRNNRGLGHENGSVESSHRYLKEAVDQALMLRGHRDFADRAAYDEFIREVVMRRNRRNAAAFRIERAQLQDLPERRTTDFVEEEALVTRCSTFTVRGILYSAPSRLIGHRLKVRLYGDRLDCYLSGALVHSTARGSRAADNRHALDYRHFIDSLRRKPQAFKGLAFRDALFPREAYRRTWEQLEGQLSQRQACKSMVGLLELAGHHGVEAVLAERLEALLAAGDLPDLKQLRDEFAPRQALCPEVVVEMPPVAIYDELLDQVAA